MFAACRVEVRPCLPLDTDMSKYDSQRPPKTAPHVSLRCLRRASGLTLEQVADEVSKILKLEPEDKGISRGTISAIEGGHRGASKQMLDALAVAYGLDPGDITTDYEPRKREQLADVVGL